MDRIKTNFLLVVIFLLGVLHLPSQIIQLRFCQEAPKYRGLFLLLCPGILLRFLFLFLSDTLKTKTLMATMYGSSIRSANNAKKAFEKWIEKYPDMSYKPTIKTKIKELMTAIDGQIKLYEKMHNLDFKNQLAILNSKNRAKKK